MLTHYWETALAGLLPGLQTTPVLQQHASRCLDNLLQHYAAPQRHYHNLNHLQAVLHAVASHLTAFRQPDRGMLALFYHDVIYDPTASDNEARSRDYFMADWQQWLPPETLQTIAHWIMATAGHQVTGEAKPDPDLLNLLDIDLSILAADLPVYQHYAAAIRQEYCHIPDAAYRAGRIRVLQDFLQRSRLFQGSLFGMPAEVQARYNLYWEINQLT